MSGHPEKIILWSRGAEWWFVAEKSDRPDIDGMPVYETLDPIVPRKSAEPSNLRVVAKRNLRSLIELGSSDRELMLKCLEELS